MKQMRSDNSFESWKVDGIKKAKAEACSEEMPTKTSQFMPQNSGEAPNFMAPYTCQPRYKRNLKTGS